MPLEKEPALKTFLPANKNLPELEEYTQTLNDEYWKSKGGGYWKGSHRVTWTEGVTVQGGEY